MLTIRFFQISTHKATALYLYVRLVILYSELDTTSVKFIASLAFFDFCNVILELWN